MASAELLAALVKIRNFAAGQLDRLGRSGVVDPAMSMVWQMAMDGLKAADVGPVQDSRPMLHAIVDQTRRGREFL